MDKNYIIGLIEGKGCFNITTTNNPYIKKDGTESMAHSTIRQFIIGMHRRDEQLLKEVQKEIGGKMYYPNRKKSNMCLLTIQDQKGREKFIRYIDSSCGFQGYKKEQYETWKLNAHVKKRN